MSGASAGLNRAHRCWAGGLWAGGCWVGLAGTRVGSWVNWQAGEGGTCSGGMQRLQLLEAKQQLPSASFKSEGWVGTQFAPHPDSWPRFARKEDLVSDGVVSEGMGTGRGTALALRTRCQGPQPGVLSSATLLLRPWARCLAAQPQVWGLLWGGPGQAPRLLHGLLLCCVPTALGHRSAPDERTLITSLPSQPGYAPCWTLPTPQPPVSGEGA